MSEDSPDRPGLFGRLLGKAAQLGSPSAREKASDSLETAMDAVYGEFGDSVMGPPSAALPEPLGRSLMGVASKQAQKPAARLSPRTPQFLSSEHQVTLPQGP